MNPPQTRDVGGGGVPKADLQNAVERIRTRWGDAALRSAASVGVELPQPFATGIEALDALSGLGGLPAGRISGLSGRLGSGTTSLLQMLAARLSRRMPVVHADLTGGLDPSFLNGFEPDLQNLYLASFDAQSDQNEVLEALRALLRAGLPALTLQLGDATVSSPLQRAMPEVAALCARAGTVMVVAASAYQSRSPLVYSSTLWIGLERTGWLEWHGDVAGIRTRLSVLRNKLAAPGASESLNIPYPSADVPRFISADSLTCVSPERREESRIERRLAV